GVVAGPAFETPRLAGSPEVANDVPVRVQNADERNIDGGETLLPPRFPQQRGGPEHRLRRGVLVIENRGHDRGGGKARIPQHSDPAALRSNMPGSDRLLPRTQPSVQAIIATPFRVRAVPSVPSFSRRPGALTTRQPPAQGATLAEFLIRRPPLRILVLH